MLKKPKVFWHIFTPKIVKMKEVEVKIRNIEKKEIIEKIVALGAYKVFSGKVVDFRFDTPERDLSRQGKALRIRQKGKYIYLNLKGKKKSRESIIGRDEIGVKISNFKKQLISKQAA